MIEFLYPQQNQLILQYKIRDRFSRATILSSHYANGLTQSKFMDTLYYAFLSDQKEIIFSSISPNANAKIICSTGDYTYSDPLLFPCDATLYLFFSGKKTDENTYLFFYTCPLEDPITVHNTPSSFTEKPSLALAYLSLLGNTKKLTVKVQALQQENEQLSQNLKEKSGLLSKVISQYNELMEVAKQYRLEAQKWHEKFIYHK